MDTEVDELYSNLNKLLVDICSFLSNETNYEKLSYHARQQADELINRSKKQLQEIAKIAVGDDNNGAYVDMEPKTDGNNESNGSNIYSSVEETPAPKPQLQQINPYANLPARDICPNVKYGILSWKCKIILKFEKVRRIYAGVHDNWFLVYSSEKDSKPIQTFNLKFHKAKVVLAKQNKNLSQDFELISTSSEGKSYYFLALTHKDMLQWTTQINRCHEYLNLSQDTSIFNDDPSETYDEIGTVAPKDEEDDNDSIYHDIDTYYPNAAPQKDISKAPELPARRCIKSNVPLPPVPAQKQSTESLSDGDHDQTPSRVSVETTSSFTSDDEDEIYQEFVVQSADARKSPMPVIKKTVVAEIYENSAAVKEPEITKPKTPAKPKILAERFPHLAVRRKPA